jgi:hypothetical protein
MSDKNINFKTGELRLTGVSEKTKQELYFIYRNSNVDINFNSFWKQKLGELKDSFPERMRKPPIDWVPDQKEEQQKKRF